MILGTVTGQVWGARQAPRLGGHKLLLVRPDRAYRYPADHVICVDPVGAEAGQRVVVCLGSPARASAGGDATPVDAAIAAIVDDVALGPLGSGADA